jgi:inosine-uridine nucleoside N-ribohydrolase
MKQKLLLDTDIGTDIDDAVCLAYLLSHPDCELLGITTVTGEAEQRAMLASALCKRAGKEVPIYPGAASPLLLQQKQLHAAQAAGLQQWDHETRFPSGEAIEFLRQTIRAHPGEIILLTIAPLTNVGLLFSVDPEIPRLLKGLVMMCGRFLEPVPEGYGSLEWNALVDAHATAIVYNAPVAIHRSVGLDVTSKVAMTADVFRSTFRDVPLFAPVLEWAEFWFREWPGTTYHDPLAAATIFRNDLCTFQRGEVAIELQQEDAVGLTRWTPGAMTGRHEIATAVDPRAFFDHYVFVVKGKRS